MKNLIEYFKNRKTIQELEKEVEKWKKKYNILTNFINSKDFNIWDSIFYNFKIEEPLSEWIIISIYTNKNNDVIVIIKNKIDWLLYVRKEKEVLVFKNTFN